MSAHIAVVGMGFIFPSGMTSADAFWQALASGTDLVGPLPPQRHGPSAVPGYPNVAGFLDEVAAFDAGLFAMNGLEASYTDPQQRLLLQATWAALEDGGFSQTGLADTRTGVFIGAHGNDYLELAVRAGCEVNAYWNAGLNSAVLANRLSYFFNWRGPSVTLNTACSSSLEALAWAVDALRQERCELAVAGGVNLILTATVGAAAARAGMLSPSGRCRTFDRAADGFVRGEGVVVLLLKPLAKARADGDRIHAVIRAAETAHGGHAHSLTTPNLKNQCRLLVETYRRAGIDPAGISYIETHGTGTSLGDSIEVEALKEAFAAMMPGWQGPPFCGLGSIKTNMGHLESAAGLAGIVKVCLAMRQARLPKLLHFSETNPLIDLADSPFHLVRETMPWDGPAPRRAGVSSFGFGGSYAHVILEEPPPCEGAGPVAASALQLLPLSAHNAERLRILAGNLLSHLESPAGAGLALAAVAHTLQRRQSMAHRLAIVVADLEAFKRQLANFLADRPGEFILGTAARSKPRQTVPASDPNEAARAWVAGTPLDLNALYGTDRPPRVSLPHYPFSQKHYWLAQ